jgi:hypothetical protein
MKVICPAIAERRAQFEDTVMTLFLLHGIGSHHPEEFLEICACQGIDVLFLIPYSWDQTQPLGVLAFALTQRHFSVLRFSRLGNPQSNRLVRIL